MLDGIIINVIETLFACVSKIKNFYWKYYFVQKLRILLN